MRIALFVALALLLPLPARAASKIIGERWYQVLLADQPVGWMRGYSETNDRGNLVSVTDMRMTIRRGEVAIRVGVRTAFEETPEGKPVEATMRQELGAIAMEQRSVFTGDAVEVISKQGQNETKQRLELAPDERDWLPPAAAQRLLEREMAAGKTEITWKMLEPAMGPKPFTCKTVVEGRGKVEVLGKTVPAVIVTQTTSALPGIPMKAYLDDKGQPVRATVSLMPGMVMTLIEADEALAKANVNPPDLMGATFIKLEQPLKEPRKLRAAVYEVKIEGDADGKETLPSAGYQAVSREGGTLRVSVDLDRASADSNDVPGDEHLRASAMLNHNDGKVKELLAKALARQPADLEPSKKAETLRRFVHAHIDSKDLSVGFASASEVAATGEGDCTEHGVLLAALLRGAGVPSRTVTGIIYVDEFLGHRGIFGYHMWTQAWIADGAAGSPGGGRWIDLDATLGDDTPFDAAHIALATSAMSDGGTFNDMAKMAGLFGRFKIRVVEAR